MPLPPDHLDPDALEPVRDLARTLREIATDLGTLTDGGLADVGGGASGRAGDAAIALRRWRGPLRDRFVALIEHEASLATTLRFRLVAEADGWDRFRAAAAEAHRARIMAEAAAPPLPG